MNEARASPPRERWSLLLRTETEGGILCSRLVPAESVEPDLVVHGAVYLHTKRFFSWIDSGKRKSSRYQKKQKKVQFIDTHTRGDTKYACG